MFALILLIAAVVTLVVSASRDSKESPVNQTAAAPAALVELTLSTLRRREAAARARVVELQTRAATARPVFAEYWLELAAQERRALEDIIAARQVKEWATGQ